jgi:hypothetical protein
MCDASDFAVGAAEPRIKSIMPYPTLAKPWLDHNSTMLPLKKSCWLLSLL